MAPRLSFLPSNVSATRWQQSSRSTSSVATAWRLNSGDLLLGKQQHWRQVLSFQGSTSKRQYSTPARPYGGGKRDSSKSASECSNFHGGGGKSGGNGMATRMDHRLDSSGTPSWRCWRARLWWTLWQCLYSGDTAVTLLGSPACRWTAMKWQHGQ